MFQHHLQRKLYIDVADLQTENKLVLYFLYSTKKIMEYLPHYSYSHVQGSLSNSVQLILYIEFI